MIEASVARNIADNITTPSAKNTIAAITSRIEEACTLGVFKCDITDLSITPCIKEYLQIHGYTVDSIHDDYGAPIQIALEW